jgi:hypothetical protein
MCKCTEDRVEKRAGDSMIRIALGKMGLYQKQLIKKQSGNAFLRRSRLNFCNCQIACAC